jgi:hypothetical protein
MDVDQPVFTQVRRAAQDPRNPQARRAYTEADKDRFKKEGRCFHCDQQGHMSKYCPKKKTQNPSYQPQYKPKPTWQTNGPKPQFQKKSFGKSQNQGFRKRNKPFHHTSQVRSARIEEIEEEEEFDEDHGQDDITSLAARTARLDESQREQWVQEMSAMGINF